MDIGYFREFKGADSVLLEGTPTELVEFARQLACFVKSADDKLCVHALGFVQAHKCVELTVVREKPIGDSGFWLLCSRYNLPAINGMLVKLAQAGSGHQYFDLFPSGTQLVVSCCEYGTNFWSWDA